MSDLRTKNIKSLVTYQEKDAEIQKMQVIKVQTSHAHGELDSQIESKVREYAENKII